MRRILLIISLVMSHLAVAATSTLYNSAVNWNDPFARSNMLASSKTPEWDAYVMFSFYEVYKNPLQHQLPINKDDQRFNTSFLDAYWGPLDNPFVRYARPAKVFVYVGDDVESIIHSYMAPIVRSATDQNYYVFTRANDRPQLLEEWIDEIKAQLQTTSLRFVVCTGYGNLPTDTCAGRGYQAEEAFALSTVGIGRAKMQAGAVASPSAYRAEGEDWHQHFANSMAFINVKPENDSILGSSLYWDDKRKIKQLLRKTTAWENYKIIRENFEKIRDMRYFTDTKNSGFMRRISWLYPDDGCWTRASAVTNHLFGTVNNPANQYARPSKIFAFGNLCANTVNHKNGKVSWWYHTAPLIRNAQTNQVYVLDPSLDSRMPMPVDMWIEAISANTGACKSELVHSVEQINVCTGYGSNPYGECKYSGVNFLNEARAALRQSAYQNLERERQVELGRDADKVLGDDAPWL